MTIELGILLSILSVSASIAFSLMNQKRSNKQENEKQGYTWGRLDEKLANIELSLNKIEEKLDNYDNEIDKRIEIALEHHIKEYHK